ncbi:MAG: PEP-CTERM sorting domain-containing protein [Tepidisphaeraceae bacterium]|jgi:hypothetical protein
MRSLFGCLVVSVCLVLFIKSAPARGDPVVVNPGYDLLQTVPGTQAYQIPMEGVPLGTYDFGGSIGVQNVGMTDTIVQRLDQAVAPSLPGAAPEISVQVDALQLRTVDQTNMGMGYGYYYVTLQSLHGGTPSTGGLDISFNGDGSSGTFTSWLDIYCDIHYGALDGPIVGPEELVLAGVSPTNWAREPFATVPPAVVINGVNAFLNGVDTSADFWPLLTADNPLVEQATNGVHVTIDGEVPEPASLSLLMVGFFGLMSRRRRAA